MKRFVGFLVILVLVVGALYLGFRFLAPPEVRSAVAAVLPVTVKETVAVPVEVEKIVTVEKIVEKPVEKVVKETVVVTPTAAPATPTSVVPTPTLVPSVVTTNTLVLVSGREISWYRSPFKDTTGYLKSVTGTVEIFAEPGVLLDATAAFDYLSAPETPVLVPEGGYTYIAVGAANISGLALVPQERNIYLVILRGIPDDSTPTDLNSVVPVSGYVRGAGIYSQLPAGAYVSLGWFLQQVEHSKSPPNCGASGCKMATIVVVDVASKSYRMWIVADLSKPREWAARN